MITFNSITIEGLGSIIKPYTYQLDRVGLNKIEGPNGAGKTTIMNGIAWAGWGKLVKPKSSLQPWPHIIDKTFRGTKVVLKFSEDKDVYEIIRCNEYKGKILDKAGKNRLTVLKNGKEVTGEGLRDKADYQRWIIKKLGYSFELFKSTILFAQELDNLMQEGGPEKKKIFDEAFETTFVNRAKEKVERRLTDKTTELAILNNNLDLLKTQLSGIESLRQMTRENKLYWQKQREEKLTNLKKQIEAENINLKDVKKQLRNRDEVMDKERVLLTANKKLKDLKDQEFKDSMVLNNKQSISEDISAKIIMLKEQWQNPPKHCGACGKPIDKESILKFKKGIKEKINTLKKQGNKAIEDLLIFETSYKELLDKIRRKERWVTKNGGNITSAGLKLTKSLNNLTVLKRVLKDLNTQFELVIDEKPPKDNMAELDSKRSIAYTNISRVEAEIYHAKKEIGLDEWLIKDPLSNSGLKAFIFDSMLGKVNNYLKPYSQIIGFGIRVFIEMEKAHKDINIAISKGGDEVYYSDLSKGQKQLVNIALAFSLSEAVNSVKPTNLLFLDELFESLNAENVDKVGDMIIKKSKNKAIHLITHQRSFSPSNCHITSVELNDKGQSIFSSN